MTFCIYHCRRGSGRSRSRVRGCPEGREQRVEAVLIGHRRQAGEDVAQVGERVLAVAFAGENQRVEDGRALPDAGDRPAVIYSLVVSCQRHGHNPHDYLRDVLSRLPAMTTADDLRPLLPAHWQPRTIAVSPLS
jgi:hypothetical protein